MKAGYQKRSLWLLAVLMLVVLTTIRPIPTAQVSDAPSAPLMASEGPTPTPSPSPTPVQNDGECQHGHCG